MAIIVIKLCIYHIKLCIWPQDSATDASDLNFFVQNASEVLRAKKEHAASWPKKGITASFFGFLITESLMVATVFQEEAVNLLNLFRLYLSFTFINSGV